jgi:LCP family protein required for cell wall assembly
VREARSNKKPISSSKAFWKIFLITFGCSIVAFTAGFGAINTFLDQKPMSQFDPTGAAADSLEMTDENLNVLVPAEGLFKTDPDFKDSKRVNVALFGNTIANEKQIGLTDTIMIASLDPDTKKVDIISVPRDTYYERDGYATSYLKINAVMETEGVKGAAEAVHNVLQGIPINYYAVIDYDGVKKIVDAIGGVEIDVPMNMKYTSKKQNLYIDLKKGKQTLDGDHAVQFLRYRKGYNEGDIGRVNAQQMFVKEAIKQSLGLNLPNVAKTVAENVKSDLNLRAILYLASKAGGMSGDNLNSYMLPGRSGEISGSGLSFWLSGEPEEVETMLREVYTGVSSTTMGAISGGGVEGE